jgi:hypothetical protein
MHIQISDSNEHGPFILAVRNNKAVFVNKLSLISSVLSRRTNSYLDECESASIAVVPVSEPSLAGPADDKNKVNYVILVQSKARESFGKPFQQVIKVIYQAKHVEENQKEIKNAECLGERFAVRVLDYDRKNFYWILEERVNGFPTAMVVPEFVELMNKILGTNYDDWFPIMALFFYGSDPEKDELMKNNEWFRNLVHALEHCDVGSHDLHPGNWGIRPSTGELVILDLGF